MKTSKKRILKHIANGLLASFVSRNNDVYGYWGIGKLCSFILDKNLNSIEIDLINGQIRPNNSEFRLLVAQFSNRLNTQLAIHKLSLKNINEAKIVLSCYENNAVIELRKSSPHKMRCRIEIINKNNDLIVLEKSVWCGKHNPKIELKSTRKY
jgi:hypothetical protein